MALAEHRRRGDIGGLGLVDGQPHRPLVGDIAEPPMPVDDGRRRRFLHDRPGRPGDDVPGLDPVDIGRDLDDAVQIMADEVGADDVAHDQLGLGGRRPRRFEQSLADFSQPLGRNFRHRFLPIVHRRASVAARLAQRPAVAISSRRRRLYPLAANSRGTGKKPGFSPAEAPYNRQNTAIINTL